MKYRYLFLVFICLHLHAQVTVIPWPSSEDIFSIDRKGDNYLICGSESNVAKCYGNCDQLVPVNLPAFSEQDRGFMTYRPDTNHIYLCYTALPWVMQIWSSKNAGASWSKMLDTNWQMLGINSLHFFDSINGVALCNSNKLLKTSDGLNTWTEGTIGGYMPASRPFGIGDSAFMIGNYPNGMNLTYDRGSNWTNAQGVTWSPVGFANLGRDSLFSISNPVNSAIKACFYSSFNRGLNWSCKPPPGDPSLTYAEYNFFNVELNKNKEVFLLARDGLTSNGHLGYGVIFKSADFGETWYKFTTPFKVDLYDMAFLNDSVALVCGGQGVLFKWNHRGAVYTDVQELNSDNTVLNIFPNPANERFKIELKGMYESTADVSIRGVDGREHMKLSGHDLQKEIDIAVFTPGIYFVEVRGKGFWSVSKLVKE